MVNIGQILIKIGTLPDVDGWQCRDEVIFLHREDFIKLMMAPGIPCYSSMKSINEKWAMLRDQFKLVERVYYPRVTDKDGNSVYGKDGAPVFNTNLPPTAYTINKARARQIITDTIPKRIRNNQISRDHYLKTGEVW